MTTISRLGPYIRRASEAAITAAGLGGHLVAAPAPVERPVETRELLGANR